MRYRAADVYAALMREGCLFDQTFDHGSLWSTRDGQKLMFPDPDIDASGVLWLDAHVVDDILKDRWTGIALDRTCERYPDG